MNWLISTNRHWQNYSLLLLRCMTGLILFVGGGGKLFGWFGGIGIKTTLMIYQTKTGIPHLFAYMNCYTEFIGGILLIIGLMTRPVAFAIMINMMVAVMVTGPNHFFMGGAAYPFSLMINAIIILLTGPMAYSLDALIVKTEGRNNRISIH